MELSVLTSVEERTLGQWSQGIISIMVQQRGVFRLTMSVEQNQEAPHMRDFSFRYSKQALAVYQTFQVPMLPWPIKTASVA